MFTLNDVNVSATSAPGYVETEASVSRFGVFAGLLLAVAALAASASSVQPLRRPGSVEALASLASWWVAALLVGWLALSLVAWMVALGRPHLEMSRWIRLVTVPGSRKLAEGLLATSVLVGASACAPGASEVVAPRIEVLRPAESATVSSLADTADLPERDLSDLDLSSTTSSVAVGSLDDARIVVDTANLGMDEAGAEPVRATPYSPGGSELGTRRSPAVWLAEESAPPAATNQYTIVEGDNFWAIAHARLSHHLDRVATDAEITPYWVELVRLNAAAIQSGNPDLVYPGEVIALPPLP